MFVHAASPPRSPHFGFESSLLEPHFLTTSLCLRTVLRPPAASAQPALSRSRTRLAAGWLALACDGTTALATAERTAFFVGFDVLLRQLPTRLFAFRVLMCVLSVMQHD